MKSDGGRGGGRDIGLDVEEAEADWETCGSGGDNPSWSYVDAK